MHREFIQKELARLLKGHKDRREVIMQTDGSICNLVAFIVRHFCEQKVITFVEIGVHMGGSFVLIGNCLKQTGKSVQGIGIDIFNLKYAKSTLLSPDEAVAALNPEFAWSIINGDSHKQETFNTLKKCLPWQKVDLLFIDGDHTTKGCMEDYKMYGPLVRSGGLIIFDDINNRPKETWRKIKKQNKGSMGFGGYGIVHVGEEGCA